MKLFRITGLTGLLRALTAWPALLLGLYFLAALMGSFIPANNGWVQPKQGRDIFVETNGVHVSIIVPMADVSDLIRPEHLFDRDLYGTHAMVGWGHSGVYHNARTWNDVRSGDIVSAVIGSDDTTLHVYHLINPQITTYRKRIRISAAQYRIVIRQIRSAFKLNAQAQSAAHMAYGPGNLFYDSTGHYSALHTCNNWTSEVLKKAGVKTGIWTPMAGGVMRWF
jgi:uncharacterized protein (TIGR02117 family)